VSNWWMWFLLCILTALVAFFAGRFYEHEKCKERLDETETGAGSGEESAM